MVEGFQARKKPKQVWCTNRGEKEFQMLGQQIHLKRINSRLLFLVSIRFGSAPNFPYPLLFPCGFADDGDVTKMKLKLNVGVSSTLDVFVNVFFRARVDRGSSKLALQNASAYELSTPGHSQIRSTCGCLGRGHRVVFQRRQQPAF